MVNEDRCTRDKGLVCAVKLWVDFVPISKFMEAGFEEALLRDIKGCVEVRSK